MEKISLKKKVEALERDEIINALQKSNWIKAKAARLLGITERMINYKIKKYGIERKEVDKE
jgi:transcriptional regulator with GAF, ATPase, and Fis domain